MTARKPNARMGRPPGRKPAYNPTRQLGRVPDDQWEQLQAAARGEGLSFTQWALGVLLRAVKRKVK